eukprot:s7475_g2.t1
MASSPFRSAACWFFSIALFSVFCKTGEIYRICQKIGAADLDGFPDEDDRLVQQHGLREFMAQPGEITLLPEELLEGLHCRQSKIVFLDAAGLQVRQDLHSSHYSH